MKSGNVFKIEDNEIVGVHSRWGNYDEIEITEANAEIISAGEYFIVSEHKEHYAIGEILPDMGLPFRAVSTKHQYMVKKKLIDDKEVIYNIDITSINKI